MKLTISLLVVLAVVALCASASAAVVTKSDQLYPGWNFIAMDGVPINPSPVSVLAVLTPPDPLLGEGEALDGRLFRMDAVYQGQIAYDHYQPEAFGNFLLGDAYWVLADHTDVYDYSALNDVDDMDIWISLPRAGMQFVGNPFSYDFPWDNAKVTDGNETVSLAVAARERNWLRSTGFWYDASVQGQLDLDLNDMFPSTTSMLPKHGYMIQTYTDKIALILEAQPH